MFLIFVSAAGSAEVDGGGAEGKPLENITNVPITHLPPASAACGFCADTERVDRLRETGRLEEFGLRGLSSFPSKGEKGR